MSAWFVSKRHIDALVTAAAASRRPELQKCVREHGLTAIGRMLWNENHLSMQARYGEEGSRNESYMTEEAPKQLKHIASYDYAPNEVPVWTLIKSCDCFDYQSCEHERWDRSKAKKLVDAIREDALARVTIRSGQRYYETKAYDDAPWGIV